MLTLLCSLMVVCVGLITHIMRLYKEREALDREIRTLQESEAWLTEELNERLRDDK